MAKQHWTEDKEVVRLLARLPREVHDKLVLLAKTNYTSLNTEIIRSIMMRPPPRPKAAK